MAAADDATITGWALAARTGDRAAAAALIGATQQEVCRFLAHLVGARHAEELTRQTYLRAMQALPSYRPGTPARVWLLALAARVAAARPADGAVATAAQPGLLGRLGPQRRLALVATQVLGLSYAQAAQVCGCPVDEVRTRVAGARDELVGTVRGQHPPRNRHTRR